jgi:carboxypeptidase Q
MGAPRLRPRLLWLAGLALLLAAPATISAEEPLSRLLGVILGPSPLEENLRQLTDEIGGRPSGSQANQRAVDWAVGAFQRAGIERVHTEDFELPVSWHEGETRIELLEPRRFDVRGVSIAWSPPTPAGGIEAPLIDVGFGTVSDFERQASHLEGALLLVDRAVLETWDDLFAEYANAPPVIERAVAAGAVGILWISTKPYGVLYRHINTHGEIDALPQAVIAREDGLRLSRFATAGEPLRLRLELPNRIGGPFEVENVIAEIPGSDKADEVVALGAHLDSWDLGSGALDNGANVALVIEVARAIRAADIQPRRTLRFMLWNGEELGLRGSRDYVSRHRDQLDRFVTYLNIDGGIGPVLGFAVAGRPEIEDAVREALRPLESWGVTHHLLDIYGGSDHVDFLLEGIPILDANQPEADYLPNYHASSDTMDKVPIRDLKLNTAIMATALLGISQREERLGKRLGRAELETLIQDTGFIDYLKDEGIWEEFLAGRRGRGLEPATESD